VKQKGKQMTETEAIRQNYELGVLAGSARRERELIAALEATDSTCADWAIAIIKETK
jgi:hypothetical protein